MTLLLYGLTLARSQSGIEPSGRLIGHDFLAFYMAGDMVARGAASALYDAAAQAAYQREFMHSVNPHWNSTCLFLNPPHYALAMSLLAPLGYWNALLAWWLLSLAAFGATATIWRTWLPAGWRGTTLMLVVCSPPFFQALAGGQNSFFSLLILSGFVALMLRGRELSAGLVLSLLAFKFQLLALPLLVLALKRRVWPLTGVLVGLLGSVLTSQAWLGDEIWPAYFGFAANFRDLAHLPGFDLTRQHSWSGALLLATGAWLGRSPAEWLSAAAALATVALLLYGVRGRWPQGGAALSKPLTLTLIATLLVTPHLFHYDMLLAALPAVLWAARAAGGTQTGASGAEPSVALVLCGVFVWLAIAPLSVAVIPLQLTPLLLAYWLLIEVRQVSATTAAPHAPLLAPGLWSGIRPAM